jgi:PTS system nitrogen regulatory IIA component
MMQLDLRDASRFLGVDEGTMYRWARRGEIPARLIHDQYSFDHVDLLEFASARGIKVLTEMLAEPDSRGQPMPSLAEAVRAGGVHHDVPGPDKAAVLKAVVDMLPLPASISPSFLYQMLLAREQLGSTGFGHGIAIPHARDPVVLRVAAPAVAVSYLATPVDFEALDGKPVHTLFTMVSPSVRVHLHLLAVLATALRDADVMAAVAARAPEPDLVEALVRVEASLPRHRDGGGVAGAKKA